MRPSDTACTYKLPTAPRHALRSEVTNATIAWGIYGRGCEEVEAFTAACIGCAHGAMPLLHGVAIVDQPGNSSHSNYEAWRCKGMSYTFQAQQMLPSRVPGEAVPVTERRYWPRTKALFRAMLAVSPNARWLIKMDTVRMPHWRASPPIPPLAHPRALYA